MELTTEFEMPVKVCVSFDPDRKENCLFLKFPDCQAVVTLDGEELGSITGTIGAGIELCRVGDKKTYFIGPEQLWEAFSEAVSKSSTK